MGARILDHAAVAGAVAALRAGGIVAYPTEAVYGLGCDPDNPHALRRLLRLKGRDASRGLILIAADFASLAPYLGQLEPRFLDRALASWPGPVTWILPAADGVPALLTGGRDAIAVRVTAHGPVITLCQAWGGPLVSTSANPSGSPPARDAAQVKAYFGDRLDCVLDGPTGGLDQPSRIYDGQSGKRLR